MVGGEGVSERESERDAQSSPDTLPAVFFIHIHADAEETGEGPTPRGPGHMARRARHPAAGNDRARRRLRKTVSAGGVRFSGVRTFPAGYKTVREFGSATGVFPPPEARSPPARRRFSKRPSRVRR